jgi:predicted Rossmann fold nucleotide-binding protein DprA/Smf involved in DNA uptake
MIHYKHWLALERAHGIGPAALKEVFDTVTALSISIEDIFNCTMEEIRNEFAFNQHILAGIEEARKTIDAIEDEYLSLVEAGIHVTLFFEEAYPSRASHRLGNQTPAVIYSIGNMKLASASCAGIISHAETSDKGERIARNAAVQLADRSITVVGGMSKGAVTSAHIAALEHGGTTIGIIPCGFLTFEMSKRLMEMFDPDRCLVLSIFSPREEYSPFNAMARNRFLCALSKAVYIIESTKEGGTIEAAKSASKLGTPLYTTQYAEYPVSAEGNPILINEYSAQPIRGRKEGTNLIPNIDHLIAAVKLVE